MRIGNLRERGGVKSHPFGKCTKEDRQYLQVVEPYRLQIPIEGLRKPAELQIELTQSGKAKLGAAVLIYPRYFVSCNAPRPQPGPAPSTDSPFPLGVQWNYG